MFIVFYSLVEAVDAPYYHDGIQFDDGGVHTITSGTFTGGNSVSSNNANYLAGIELDNGVLNLYSGNTWEAWFSG